jgi:hypothetical protein
MAVGLGDDEEWWTLQVAGDFAGTTDEAIRRWAKAEPPRVRSKSVTVGKRRRTLVPAADVRREAALPSRRRRPSPAPTTSRREGELLDRATVFEEVARRRRSIDERRQEIEELHHRIEEKLNEIAGEQREIEVLLIAPAFVPGAN